MSKPRAQHIVHMWVKSCAPRGEPFPAFPHTQSMLTTHSHAQVNFHYSLALLGWKIIFISSVCLAKDPSSVDPKTQYTLYSLVQWLVQRIHECLGWCERSKQLPWLYCCPNYKLKLKTHNPVFVVTFVRSKEEGSKGRQQTSNNNRLIIWGVSVCLFTPAETTVLSSYTCVPKTLSCVCISTSCVDIVTFHIPSVVLSTTVQIDTRPLPAFKNSDRPVSVP